MTMFEINVDNQAVEITSISETVENTENLYSAHFTFSNDWNGFTKYAVFKNLSCENEIQVAIPNTNAVLIPNEILKIQGLLQVGVYGYYRDVFKPTTYSNNTILIKRGVNVNANNPHGFTPSEFFRLLTDINNVKTDLTNHINDFNNPHNVTKSQLGLSNVENLTAKQINNISTVGNRNYLTNSATMPIMSGDRKKGAWRTTGNGIAENITISDNIIEGVKSGVRLTINNTVNQIGVAQNGCILEANEKYNLSFYCRGSQNNLSIRIQPFFKTGATSGTVDLTVTTDWKRYVVESPTVPSTTDIYSIGFIILRNGNPLDSFIEICAPNFYKSGFSPDWTPAPEDVEIRISALENLVISEGV